MQEQQSMIRRVRELCHADERLAAAMMYGSFAREEGDAYSDIEFVFFFRDELLNEVDQQEWVTQIASVELYFTNEFGNGTAIFENLIRGEFHFDRESDIPKVETWGETDKFPSLESTLILDRTGELTRSLLTLVGPEPVRDSPERVRFLCYSFINWTLFGSTVLDRGELARALALLGHVQLYLLWLVRLSEGSTQHWPTPSRLLEEDVSRAAYSRYIACTAGLERGALTAAYALAWSWGNELMCELAARHAIELSPTLLQKLDARFGVAGDSSAHLE